MTTRRTRSKRKGANLRLELYFLRMSQRNLSIATHDAILKLGCEIQELKKELNILKDDIFSKHSV